MDMKGGVEKGLRGYREDGVWETGTMNGKIWWKLPWLSI